jgi:hypothetical protein
MPLHGSYIMHGLFPATDRSEPNDESHLRGGGQASCWRKELRTAAVGDKELEVELVLGDGSTRWAIHRLVGAINLREGEFHLVDTSRAEDS